PPAPTTSASSRSATPGSPMSSVSLPCCCSGEPGIALGSTEEEAMAADIHEQLTKYLTDAHSIEQQALAQLRTAPDLAGDPEIAGAFRQHLTETETHERITRELLEARDANPSRLKDNVRSVGRKAFRPVARLARATGMRDDAPQLAQTYAEPLDETREHAELVAEQLQALGGDPSSLKDAALRLRALNWGAFFQGHPDTPGKLAAFAYAFEHLEIGGYEQLRLVAERAGDEETVRTADRILGEERTAAERR